MIFMPLYGEKKRRYQLERLLAARCQWIRENGPCKKCGSRRRLEVDHRDPKTKITHRVWSWSRKRREAELAKCQVLCYLCHRQKTVRELTKPLVHGQNAYKSSKCRCDICRQAARDNMRRWRASR